MITDTPAAGSRSRPARPPRTVAGVGRLYFWRAGSLWIGQGHGRTEWHAHHAHQLTLALEGSFSFRSAADGPWTAFEAAFVRSHHEHQFDANGATLAHLFVEPESREGRALSQQLGSTGLAVLPGAPSRAAAGALLDAWRVRADAEFMVEMGQQAVRQLAGSGPPTATVDPRLVKAIDHVRSQLRGPVTLADAAAAACLSPSRFRHLFVAQTGTSFRAYLLWLRLIVAIEAARAGASWTAAAHDAGFADSAHLARTHKRMFGIEPTAIRLG